MDVVTFLLVANLIGGAGLPQVAPDSGLTRAGAIAAALRAHPALSAARSVIVAGEARHAQARSARLPTLDVALSATRWDWVMPNKQIYLDGSRNDVLGQLSLQQTIYDGGVRASRIRIAESGLSTAELGRDQVALQVAFEVERAFLAALRVHRLVGVHEAALAALREHLTTARLLYEAGRASQVDVLKIRVQVAIAENDLASASAAVASARVDLAAAMGLDSLGAVQLVDSPDPDYVALNRAEWRAAAAFHPALRAAQVTVRESGDRVALARSAYFPRLSLQGAYTREGGELIPGHPNWQVGLGVSLPLFDGGSRRADVAAARASSDEAAYRVTATRQRVIATVERGLIRLEDAERRVRSAAEVEKLAEESLRAAALRYRAGQSPVLDVLDGETTLLRARTEHVQALSDVALVVGELRRDAGVAPEER